MKEKKEKSNHYFELDKESPYMMLVTPINKNKRLPTKSNQTENMLEIVKQARSEIPAVTHIDYSARVQTVDKKINDKFYEIIKEFENEIQELIETIDEENLVQGKSFTIQTKESLLNL